MTAFQNPDMAVRRFFSGLTEYAFCGRLGVADPPLVDYVAEMLVRFLRNDALFHVRNPLGRRLDQVLDMIREAEARHGEARRDVHRHIGDFTLFWMGVYPEVIHRLQKSGSADSLIDYRAQGKRAYLIASSIPSSEDSGDNSVLQRLSRQFELCVYGLGEVRREWERRDGDDGPRPLLIA